MLVMGVDPGVAITGYGFVQENAQYDLEVVTYGVITTPADLPFEKRLLSIYQQMKELILLHHPDSGAVEKLFFHRNVTTAMSVGQARGVIMLSLAQAEIEIMEYTPLEVKQAVSGFGRADKKQVQQMVTTLLGLEKPPYPDDAADALAIAICHLHSYRIKRLG